MWNNTKSGTGIGTKKILKKKCIHLITILKYWDSSVK